MRKIYLVLFLILFVCSLSASTTKQEPIITTGLIVAVLFMIIVSIVIGWILFSLISQSYCSRSIPFLVGHMVELSIGGYLSNNTYLLRIYISEIKLVEPQVTFLYSVFIKSEDNSLIEIRKGEIFRNVPTLDPEIIKIDPFPINISFTWVDDKVGGTLNITGELEIQYYCEENENDIINNSII